MKDINRANKISHVTDNELNNAHSNVLNRSSLDSLPNFPKV